MLFQNFMKDMNCENSPFLPQINSKLPKIVSNKSEIHNLYPRSPSPRRTSALPDISYTNQSVIVRRKKDVRLDDFTLALPINNIGIRFYDLKSQKTIKEIQDAVALVSYLPDTAESKFGSLTYLGTEKSKIKNLTCIAPEYFVEMDLDHTIQ